MKRTITLLLLLSSLLLSLISCSKGQVTTGQLLDKISALFPDMPSTESIYHSDTALGASTLSEQDAAYIYTGEYGTLAEWAMVEEYSVRLPDQPQIYEIHILKVKNEADGETVSKILCRRADLLADYFQTPEKAGDYDYKDYAAEVYVKGSYIFLLATPNNAAAIELIDKLL